MNDRKRLEEKLAKLTQGGETIGPGGRRIASGADADGLRAALLAEIDETVLARNLRFRNGLGDLLELEVSGRRLLRVRSVPEGAVPTARMPLLTQPIGAEDAGQLDLLAAVLARFLSGGNTLDVTADPLDRRPDPGNVGRTAEALAAAWSTELAGEADTADDAATATGDALDRFLAASAGTALAWVRLVPAGVATGGGEPEARKRLTGLVPEGAAALDAVLGDASSGRCVLLRAGDEVLFYGAGDGAAVALLGPDARAGRLLADWDAAHGRG